MEMQPQTWISLWLSNPIALRKSKFVYNFGLSECNRVKAVIFTGACLWHVTAQYIPPIIVVFVLPMTSRNKTYALLFRCRRQRKFSSSSCFCDKAVTGETLHSAEFFLKIKFHLG